LQPGIVFIRLRLLGDIVFTIPAMNLARRRFPDAPFAYIVEERFQGLHFLLPMVDHWITVPRKAGLSDLIRFRHRIRSLSASTLIDFHSGPKSALLSKISGIKQRIGYRTTNRNWGYSTHVPRYSGSAPCHSVLNQIRLLDSLGIVADAGRGFPSITPPVWALRQLEDRFPGSDSSSSVIIHVGAGNRFRDWGEDRFIGLITRLVKRGLTPVLVGDSVTERSRSERLANEKGVIDLTGKLCLPELFVLISRAAVYFGADSGPLHLASVTGVPIVALYGANLPEISGPWRESAVTILQKPLSCRPCSQRTCIYDTIRCLREISVDEVYEAIVQYIA